MIFLPVLAMLLLTGYRQYQQALQEFEDDTNRLINLFIEEQIDISSQAHQLLTVLSHVPAVNNLDIAQCNELLKKIHGENPQYSTIVVSSSEGLIDCCAIPLEKTINVSDRNWFKRIRENREFTIDNFIISRTSKKASLPFAYPILDKDGNLKAAVGAAFNLKYYNKLFEKIALPEDYVIMLTDSNGMLLYQSFADDDCLGKPITECRGFTIPPSGSEKKNFEVKDTDGISRLYRFEWLRVGQENNEICFLVGISKQIIFSDVFNSLLKNLVILAFFAACSLLIAWFTGKKILLDPINMLVQKTKGIKQGTWATSTEGQHFPEELELLSKAFNEMVVDLSRRENERDKALVEAQRELAVRKEIEKALSESEEHLKVLFDQAADAIYVSRLDGRLTNVNRAACKATGYSEEELLQMTVVDIDANIFSLDDLNEFFMAIRAGEQTILTSVHKRKDGLTFPAEITISRIETSDGVRIMGLARDITERMKFEEQSNQTQRLESIGRLSGGIAHDLNNLLTPILGYGELIMNDSLTHESTKDKLQRILKASTGARDLVRQLLAFSRKQVLEYQPLNINLILDDFQDLIRRTLREDIEVSLTTSSDIRLVMADKGQLEQVIMNLSVNAADSMPGGGKLSIATAIEDLDEKYVSTHQGVTAWKYVMLSVSDTGCGMDKDIQAQIFEPFFSTKGELGTGLGLSTVYGIVKQHNGNIGMYSEPGIGTTFKVYLPALSEQENMNEKIVTPVVSKKGESKSATILLVEDSDQVRETVYDILVQQGYGVLQATSGGEALSKITATERPVHLLLTDVVMPDMNGKELYNTLSETYPSLKVLYMSGYTADIIGHHGMIDGDVQFINKPFTIDSIVNKVRDVIDS
jgi:PAS domain S-box-containing protein